MRHVIWSGTLALLLLVPAVPSTVQPKSLKATISVVYLGTRPTIVAYATWASVLSQLPVSVAASFLYAVPILAMLLAWLVIGEIPSISMVTGAILAISGVAV